MIQPSHMALSLPTFHEKKRSVSLAAETREIPVEEMRKVEVTQAMVNYAQMFESRAHSIWREISWRRRMTYDGTCPFPRLLRLLRAHPREEENAYGLKTE